MDTPPTFRSFCSAIYRIWSSTVTGSRSASYVILVALLAAVSIVFAATMEKALWLRVLVGVAPTFVFFFVALIYAVFSLWRDQRIRISELTQRLAPAFSLSVDKSGPIVIAIDRYIADGRRVRSRYVRIRADTVSERNVTGGVAFIIQLTKRPLQSESVAEIPLPQPVMLLDVFGPFTIYHGVPKMIDFVKCDEIDNKLSVVGAWPVVLEDALNENGFYTFNIRVNAGIASQSRRVEVMWNGKWDEMTARDVT